MTEPSLSDSLVLGAPAIGDLLIKCPWLMGVIIDVPLDDDAGRAQSC